MAILRSNFQDPAAFKDAVDAAEAALPDAFNLGSSFADLGTGQAVIVFRSDTQITGHFQDASGMPMPISFEMRGSGFGSGSTVSVTYVRFDDSSTWPPVVDALEMWGNVTVSADGSMVSGAISRMQYTSAEGQVTIRGNLDINGLESGSISGIAEMSIDFSGPENVHVSVSGSFGVDLSGGINGTLTGLEFSSNGQFVRAVGLSRPYSVLELDDADSFLAALLRGDDQIVGLGLDQQLKGYRGDDTVRGAEGDDTLSGGDGNDRLVGAAGRDILNGGDGVDDCNGGVGNDILIYGAGDTLNGGANIDKLKILHAAVDLTALSSPDNLLVSIEQIDLRRGDHTLTLGESDVLAMSRNDKVKIFGDGNDTVSIASAQSAGTDLGNGFMEYTIGLATLIVDADIVVT